MDKTEYRKYKINEYYKNKYIQKKIIDNYKIKIKKDPINRIINSISKRTLNHLKKNKIKRTFKYNQYLGCTLEEFKNYLISKFEFGMMIENYGFWEIDHIMPISKFNFNDINDIKKCCHYTNLQPMWKTENRKKSNKVINL